MLSLSTGRGRLVTPTTQLYMVGTEDTYYFTVSTQLIYRSSSAYVSFSLVDIRHNRHYLTTKNDIVGDIHISHLWTIFCFATAHQLRTSTVGQNYSIPLIRSSDFLVELNYLNNQVNYLMLIHLSIDYYLLKPGAVCFVY